jgi:hypothetical protein
MRRALPWLLCIVAVAVIATPIAQGTSSASSAKDPRVAGLIKKVNTLQKQVTVLIAKSNCLGVQGVVLRFSTTSGYIFTPDAGATFQIRSAFDAPVTGETPQALFATINPSCVTGSNASYRPAGPGMKSFVHPLSTR